MSCGQAEGGPSSDDDSGAGIVRTVVVKRGATARLRHEADMLRAARHPGVVELIGLEHDGDHSVLTMRCAGEHSLADLGGLPIEVVAGVTAAVAEILADLHHLGITHGRISADHIVIDDLGRPVLCGWAEGDHHSTEVDHHAAPRAERRRPTSDVADLGALILHLLGSAEPTMSGRPHRSRRDTHLEALASLGARAAAEESSTRPSARALASAIWEAVPGARLPAPTEGPQLVPGGSDSEPPAPDEAAADPFDHLRQTAVVEVGHRVPVGALKALMTLLAVISLATFATLRAVAGGDEGSVESTDLVAPEAPANSAPATTALGIDVGVDDSSRLPASPRTIVEHDGHRFEVGETGDRVLTLAMRCTDVPAVVLQRPMTDEVFVFEDWPERGQPVEATAVARVPADAVPDALVATDLDGRRCGALRVVAGDGTAIDVPLEQARRTEDETP